MSRLLRPALDFFDNPSDIGQVELVRPVALARHTGSALTSALPLGPNPIWVVLTDPAETAADRTAGISQKNTPAIM